MSKPNYILNESVVNTIALYMILKKLMTPFDKWDAYKFKLIDKNGKKLKNPTTSKERESWDLLTRFCRNFKVIMQKTLGKSKMINYLTLAYLLKENINYFYVNHNKEILNESLLEGMTYEKQNSIYTFIKRMNEIYDNEKITEENVELKYLQYEPHVARLVEELNFKIEELI